MADNPQITTALGAAEMARRKFQTHGNQATHLGEDIGGKGLIVDLRQSCESGC